MATRVHPDGPAPTSNDIWPWPAPGWHQDEAFVTSNGGDPVATALALAARLA